MIELCTFVYKFQKRYWWVLSSLAQQLNAPPLKITTDLCDNDPYLNVAQTQKTFSSLNMSFNMHTPADMGRRGFIRTKNVQNASAEWLLFLDADDVFAPDFFAKLNVILAGLSEADKNKVISIPRLTMAPADGYKLVDSVTYDNIIPAAYAKTDHIKKRYSRHGAVSGAGYFQLVHVPTMRQRRINSYVDGTYDVDLMSSKSYYRMRSDMVFRKRFDGVLPIRELSPIVHVNHYRREKDPQFDTIQCH
jgi:hypothetical protein